MIKQEIALPYITFIIFFLMYSLTRIVNEIWSSHGGDCEDRAGTPISPDSFETRGTGSKVQGGALAPPWDFNTICIFLCNNLLNQTIKIIQKTKVNFVQFLQFYSKE